MFLKQCVMAASAVPRAHSVSITPLSRGEFQRQNRRLGHPCLIGAHPGTYQPWQGATRRGLPEKVEAEHASLSRIIAARDIALSGPLTVTVPHLMVQSVLAPILGDFIRAHPDIELAVIGSIETLNLAEREADVAIRIADAPDPDLVGRQVAVQKSAVYASKSYVAEFEKDPNRCLRWLRFLHWQPTPKEVIQIYPNTRTVMALDDMVAMLGAIRADLGASRIACVLGDTDPDLARVPGLPLMPYLPIWVLTHEDLRAVPRIAAFTDFVSAALRRKRSAFAGGVER